MRIPPWLFLHLCLFSGAAFLSSTCRAQFTFATNGGAITISGYTGPGGIVVIPSSTNGYPIGI